MCPDVNQELVTLRSASSRFRFASFRFASFRFVSLRSVRFVQLVNLKVVGYTRLSGYTLHLGPTNVVSMPRK